LLEGRVPQWVQRIEAPLFRLAGVDPTQGTGWRTYALALLTFSFLGMLFVYTLQRLQGVLPLNPAGMPAVSADSAFNSAVSFVTNTNWQGYGGESTMSYLTQMLAFTVQNFVSAASGIAVAFVLIRGFVARATGALGNFWVDLTRITLWLLLPLSLVLALCFTASGVVQNFNPYQEAHTIESTAYQVPKTGADGQPVLCAPDTTT
jgi:K+-transporting ATPase ATPase A chain